MTVIEFIKKNGWGGAESDIEALESGLFTEDDFIEVNGFDIEELKVLVESHELVEKVGGLENAKTFDEDCMYCISHITDLDGLKKSILDVESCQ